MSTKNLARTVIEGGRARRNTFDRRSSNSAYRRGVRQELTRERINEAFGEVVYSRRKSVGRCFSDKLSPGERWLGKQVGRPWNKVRSELFQRFDIRTTAGRHIVFDHLLRMVREFTNLEGQHCDFRVDRHGILRKEQARERFRYVQRGAPQIANAVYQWLAGRRVGERGGRYYWFEPTAFDGYRQAKELTPGERSRFCALPLEFQTTQDPLRSPRLAAIVGEKQSWFVVR